MQDSTQNSNTNSILNPPPTNPVSDPPLATTTTTTNPRPAFMTFEDTASAAPTTVVTGTASATEPPVAGSYTPTPPAPSNGRKIATILAIVVLLGATLVGGGLVVTQQLQTSQAWDCDKYNFKVTQEGVVTAINGSTRNEPSQQAVVKINNSVVATLQVPALSPGQSATLDTISVPDTAFSWEVTGSLDCKDGGSYSGGSTVSAQCTGIRTVKADGTAIATNALSSLKTGDVVRFVASYTTTSGAFDKARFTINGALQPEVITKTTDTNEFYYEYTIPAGVTTFSVKAEVHHAGTNKWY